MSDIGVSLKIPDIGETPSHRARHAAEAVARRSYGKLIAFLAARTREVAAAEDALSDAFAAALASWPVKGCPANPEAWLLTAARRKWIDSTRRQRRDEFAAGQLRILGESLDAAESGNSIPDHRLALMFACAHPAIEDAVRAPLILQTVLGMDAKRIASAFLTSPTAMGKRLVRAKEKIRQAGIPFRVPERDELAERLEAVLNAIYAAFSEGWSDAQGTDAARRDLTGEALFLARVVTELLPEEPEPAGLLALMLYAESRRGARRDAQGEYVSLPEQDRALWNPEMIAHAEALLQRAGTMNAPGRFQLEAALQSAHIHRLLTGQSNWVEIIQIYDALFAITASPVVSINRTLALAEVDGAAAGLEALNRIGTDPRLTQYQPFHAARAELLARTGAHQQARDEYEIAIGLERDTSVRRFLQRRQALL